MQPRRASPPHSSASLLEQGLDLKLTTYRVLATSPSEGLVERVPDCMPLAQARHAKWGEARARACDRQRVTVGVWRR